MADWTPAPPKPSVNLDLRTLDAVLTLARKTLVDDGYIRLGSFLTAMQKGTTKIKYGRYVSAHWKDFQGITDDQLMDLYNFVYRHLEEVEGPLRCKETQRWSSSLAWTYAGVRCCSCGKDALASPEDGNLDLETRRERALGTGHPDAGRRRVARNLPDTTLFLTPEGRRAA